MKRKSEWFAKLIVGGFMIMVMLLLGYFTIVVSGKDVFGNRRHRPIRVAFAQVGGLKDHDSVMYRGTKVGVVERVEVTATNLVVVALVDESVVMRSGYRASVCNLSMLGGNYLSLEEGAGAPLELSRTVLQGETPSDWMSDVAQIARNLNELTSKADLREIITNFVVMSARARDISTKIDALVVRANALAERADGVVQRIERGEGTVGKLLSGETAVYDDLKETLANARAISERLNRAQTYDELEAGIAAFRKAAESFDGKATFDRANVLLEHLTALAADLRQGKGTLGKLAVEDGMYNEVEGLIRDCRQILDNYRDTTPISTFSSLATGAL